MQAVTDTSITATHRLNALVIDLFSESEPARAAAGGEPGVERRDSGLGCTRSLGSLAANLPPVAEFFSVPSQVLRIAGAIDQGHYLPRK